MREQTIYTDKPTVPVLATESYPEQDIVLLDIAQMVLEMNGYNPCQKAIDDICRLYQYEMMICGYTEIPRNIIETMVNVLCSKNFRKTK